MSQTVAGVSTHGHRDDAQGGPTRQEGIEMPATESLVHFRCRCGRSVAAPVASPAADTHRCSRCRELAAYRQKL